MDSHELTSTRAAATATLVLWLGSATVVGAEPGARTIQVQRYPGSERQTVTIALRDAPTGTLLTTATIPPDRVSTSVRVVAAGERRLATCTDKTLWCPEVEVPVEATDAVLLPVFSRATLRTSVAVEGPQPLPSLIDLQGLWRNPEPGRAAEEFRFTLRAPLDQQGRMEVAVPRGRLDLRFSAPSYAPVYRLGVASAKWTALSTVILRPGSSVAGRVHDALTYAVLPGVAVSLSTTAPTASAPPLESEWRVKSDEDGFFQITGVPSGKYWLTLHSPSHGRAELPCDVTEEAETFLPDLSLEPYGLLEVRVDPPVAPSGGPWTVAVRRLSDRMRQDTQAWGTATTRDGRALFRRITPGQHEIEVKSETNVWSYGTYQISGAAQQFTISIPSVSLKGSVRRGGEPVQGALVEVSTGEADSFSFVSDADGRFEGALRPVREALYVAVQESPGAPRVSFTISAVPADETGVFLDLELGTIEIGVRVVDQSETPVAGAAVHLVSTDMTALFSGQSTTGRTDASGIATLTPTRPGRYRVWAETASHEQSERVEIPIDEGSRSELVLRLNPSTETDVTVLSASGSPVPGADVVFVGSDGARTRTTTDLAGRGRIRLSTSGTQFSAKVFAPSHVLWAGCVSAQDGQVSIRLPGAGGGIRLSPPDSLSPDGRVPFLVTSEGGVLSRSDLASWRLRIGASQHADTATPQLALGGYALVWWPGTQEQSLIQAACAGAARLISQDAGVLTGLNELTLRATAPESK